MNITPTFPNSDRMSNSKNLLKKSLITTILQLFQNPPAFPDSYNFSKILQSCKNSPTFPDSSSISKIWKSSKF